MSQAPSKYSIFYVEDGKLSDCFTDTAWTLFGKLALLNARGTHLGCIKPKSYDERFYSDFGLFAMWMHMYHESTTHIIAFGFDEENAFWLREMPITSFAIDQ